MKRIRVIYSHKSSDWFDILQPSFGGWLLQLSGTTDKYWLMPCYETTHDEPYVLENFDTHKMRYVYASRT